MAIMYKGINMRICLVIILIYLYAIKQIFLLMILSVLFAKNGIEIKKPLAINRLTSGTLASAEITLKLFLPQKYSAIVLLT